MLPNMWSQPKTFYFMEILFTVSDMNKNEEKQILQFKLLMFKFHGDEKFLNQIGVASSAL